MRRDEEEGRRSEVVVREGAEGDDDVGNLDSVCPHPDLQEPSKTSEASVRSAGKERMTTEGEGQRFLSACRAASRVEQRGVTHLGGRVLVVELELVRFPEDGNAIAEVAKV